MAERYFTAEEASDLILNAAVSVTEGEIDDWTSENTAVVRADDGIFYKLQWLQSLQGYEHTEYWEQTAKAVHQVQEVTTVTKWVEI